MQTKKNKDANDWIIIPAFFSQTSLLSLVLILSVMKAPLFLAFLFSCNIVFSQNAKYTANPATDSFSMNIKSAVTKVLAIAANPKKSAGDLATDFVTIQYNNKIYLSSVKLEGGEKSYVVNTDVDWEKGISHWQWVAVVASAPKGTITNKLENARSKIDSLLKKITKPAEQDAKHHVSETDLLLISNSGVLPNDSLCIWVKFTKPEARTKQEVIDSLLTKYKGGLFGRTSSADATIRLGDALFAEKIPKDQSQKLFEDLIKEVADKDIYAAYEIYMNVSSDLDVKKMYEKLSPGQKETFRTEAKKIIDLINEAQANKGREPEPPQSSFKPVTTQKQVQVKPKYATNTSLEPNYKWLDRSDYTLAEYDPSSRKYRLVSREFKPEKKTFFKTNENVSCFFIYVEEVTEDYIDKHFKVSPDKYLFCSQCKGHGAIYKTQIRSTGGQWEQLSFNVYAYTPGRVTAEWQERFVCPNCFGAGRKKL